MRILYFHQYFNGPQAPGGTRSYEFARRWVAGGHEVHLITADRQPRDRALAWRSEIIDGIVVHYFPVRYDNAMSVPRRMVAFAQYALAASVKAAMTSADVMFASSTPLTVAIPARIASRLRSTPFVFEVRDLWPEMPVAVGALTNPLAIRAARWLERSTYRRARSVVALSPQMADGVAAAGIDRSRVTVAPNAADIDRFGLACGDPRAVAYRHGVPGLGDRPLVIYCGSLGRLNNLEYLVRVACESQSRGLDPVYVVHGSGAEQEALRALAERLGVLGRSFHLREPLAKDAVPIVFAAADLATSLFAPIPQMEANSANKFFDALAAGRPIGVNYGGWQAELIRKHDIGMTLDPYRPDEAARQIAGYLGDPERARRAGARARELAETKFSRDRIARVVLDVLVDAAK